MGIKVYFTAGRIYIYTCNLDVSFIYNAVHLNRRYRNVSCEHAYYTRSREFPFEIARRKIIELSLKIILLPVVDALLISFLLFFPPTDK